MSAPHQVTIGSPLLIPFDGSRQAEVVLPYVPLLADGEREVVLLQVIPEPQPVSSPIGDVMLSADDVREAAEAAARTDLDRAAACLASIDPELKVRQVIETGDPYERINDVVVRSKARAILLSSQGVSATGPGGFGSVVGRVARTASVPVMIVQPNGAVDGPGHIARLLFAHDGSERAARALPLAHDLARRLSAHVHIIAVVEDEESLISTSVAATIDPQLGDEARADALNVARRRLETTGSQFLRQGLPASWQVLTGPAAAAIIDASIPQDVLIITSHGQSGSEWMLGSVAEKLIRESHVPVILLRTPPREENAAP